MGRILLEGPLSGQRYAYRIAGEQPTIDEQRAADALMRQREVTFAEQYQEQFGENLLPGRGLGAQVGDFFRGIPRGVGGIFEGAATGAVTPFSEETELGLREGIRGLGQSWQSRFAPPVGQEDMVGGRLGEAVGSMLGIAGVGAGTTLAAAPLVGPAAPLLGFGAAAGVGAAAGAGEASERARAFGATQEERNLATRLGLLPGAMEAVPLVRLSRVLERGGLRERLVRAAITGGEEAAQEAASTIAQNLIEQGVYNPEQGTFTDTGEALGYGFGAGALVQAMMDLALPGRLRSRAGPGTVDPEPAQLQLPPPSPEERVATPPVIQVAPEGPEQLRDAPGINVPAYPRSVEPDVAAAPATPTAPATPAAPVTPVAPVAPAPAPPAVEGTPLSREDLTRILDDLGVGKTAAVRNAVRSGALTTREALTAQLQSYGANSRVPEDIRGRVNSWLATPTQGAPSAQTQEAPDTSVGRRTGISSQDSVIQPRRGDVAARAPRADTPDAGASLTQAMGETVSGAPAADAPAAAQPAALTQQGLASIPPSTLEAAPPVPSSSAVLGETGVTGAYDPAFVDRVRAGAERGVATPADVLVEPQEIAQRAGDQATQRDAMAAAAATPVAQPEVSEVATPGVRGATFDPGALSPAPSPSPIDQAPADLRGVLQQELEAQRAADIDRASAAQEQLLETQAKAAVAQQFDRVATQEVRDANNQLDPGDRETTAFRPADAVPVIALLSGPKARTPEEVEKTKRPLTSEEAAYRYFSQYRDPGLALSAIASDAAEAAAHERALLDGAPTEGRFIPSTWTAKDLASVEGGQAIVLPPQDLLVVGTGRLPGQRAMEWAQANLSPETRAELISLMERPATAERPGYQYRNVMSGIKGRDEAQVQRARAAREVAEAQVQRARASREAVEARRREYQSLTDEEREARRRLGQFSFTWAREAHPLVGSLIRAGNFTGALGAVANTTGSRTFRRLARALLPKMRNTRSRMISPEQMDRIRAITSPETPTLGTPAAAIYVYPMSPEAIQRLRDTGHAEAADILQEFSGQVLFNEAAGVSGQTSLHEAVHVVADATLANRSHPLTRRLETLRTDLLKTMPASTYGLSDVRELLAEGLTNPAFRRDLAYVTPGGERISGFQRFKNILRDFMRSLMGLPSGGPEGPRTARDLIDASLNDVMALGPDDVGAGDIIGSSARLVDGARETLEDVAGRVRVPGPQDFNQMRAAIRDSRIPTSWKDTFTRLFVPLEYVADNAARYLPTARQVADAVGQHQAEIRRLEKLTSNTIDRITGMMKPFRNQQEVIDNFNRSVFQGTLAGSTHGVDFRKPRKTYAGDPEALIEYDRVRKAFDALPAEMQRAVNTTFGLPSALNKQLEGAIRERLEALVPGNKTLQNKIYGAVYNKIFAAELVDPYAALRRSGAYWVSYTGTDPITGQPETFKHAFETEAAQREAIRMLNALESGVEKNSITPYMNVGTMRNRPQVPMEFVANILDAVEGSAELARMMDPETGKPEDLKQKIVELMFDTLPETSFVNSFRKRKGTRGFIGDFTPFTQGLTYGDTLKNIKDSNGRLGRQIADLRYGARFAALRKGLQDEYDAFLAGRRTSGTSAEQQAGDVAEAARYHDTLRDYTFVPFQQRSNISRNLTGGAYMLTLGLNASTALITMSQVPLYVAPYLAGKHGMGNTTAAIGLAHRLLTGSGRMREQQYVNEKGEIVTERAPVSLWGYSLDNYDTSTPESAYLEPLQRIARINGVFNHSLVQDQLLGEQPTLWQRFAGWSGFMQHHAERYSREVALGAAYHLELQRAMGSTQSMKSFGDGLRDGTIRPTPQQMDAAALAAVEVSEKTNGPIYAAAGPMMSQGDIGSVLYLFKRHPLSMLNLLFQTAKRSNPWGTNDPKDRQMAQRQLGGMVGMMGLMAGAMGMPLMQQIGWIYDLLISEEDEPDFDTVVRMTLGEAGAFGALDFLTGLRVSERIGLGSAIYRPGFASDSLPIPYQILEGVGGPVVGLGLKYLDRVPDLLNRGEYWRAAEASAPSALGNALRAYRFSQEGVQTMRGDPIVGDVGPFTTGAQALGFMSAQYSQQLAINAERTRIGNAIDTRRSRLLQQRYIALRSSDWETVRDIDREIQEFNQRHPTNAITRETVRDSLRSHRQTSERMEFGVNVSPANRAYIDRMVQFGDASLWDGR